MLCVVILLASHGQDARPYGPAACVGEPQYSPWNRRAVSCFD